MMMRYVLFSCLALGLLSGCSTGYIHEMEPILHLSVYDSTGFREVPGELEVSVTPDLDVYTFTLGESGRACIPLSMNHTFSNWEFRRTDAPPASIQVQYSLTFAEGYPQVESLSVDPGESGYVEVQYEMKEVVYCRAPQNIMVKLFLY